MDAYFGAQINQVGRYRGAEAVSERDPRVDPKPGDVLRKERDERWIEEVFVHGRAKRVNFVRPDLIAESITIGAHRKWAATATVVRRAEEPKGETK